MQNKDVRFIPVDFHLMSDLLETTKDFCGAWIQESYPYAIQDGSASIETMFMLLINEASLLDVSLHQRCIFRMRLDLRQVFSTFSGEHWAALLNECVATSEELSTQLTLGIKVVTLCVSLHSSSLDDPVGHRTVAVAMEDGRGTPHLLTGSQMAALLSVGRSDRHPLLLIIVVTNTDQPCSKEIERWKTELHNVIYAAGVNVVLLDVSLVSDTRCLCHFHELMLRGASLYQATIRSGLLLSRLVASPAPEVLSESLMRRCFLSTGSARLSDQIFDQKQRNDSETHALNAYKHMSPVLNPWCSPPLLPSVGFTPESKECNENASSFLQDQLVASVHAMRRGHRLLWINGGSGGDGNLKAFTLALLHWTLSRFPTVPFTQLLRRQAFGPYLPLLVDLARSLLLGWCRPDAKQGQEGDVRDNQEHFPIVIPATSFSPEPSSTVKCLPSTASSLSPRGCYIPDLVSGFPGMVQVDLSLCELVCKRFASASMGWSYVFISQAERLTSHEWSHIRLLRAGCASVKFICLSRCEWLQMGFDDQGICNINL